jgi:hypothetical protein
VLRTGDQLTAKPDDLKDFVQEANEVYLLTQQTGWRIITRDLLEYRNGLTNRLAYIDPSKPEHKEARILFIAVDKIFTLINDYKENREKAVELLQKLENPDLATVMDIDNEITKE